MTRDEIEKHIKVAEHAAEKTDCRIRRDYSGRCMYGATCLGVVGDKYELEEFRAEYYSLCKAYEIEAHRGWREDNMGLSYIMYAPYLKTNDQQGVE